MEIFSKSIPKEVNGVDIIYPSRGSVVHKNYLYGSAILLCLTSVFMILPLPNIPFFGILFCTYSHWRASQGSQKLLHLVSDASCHLHHPVQMAKGKEGSTHSDEWSDNSKSPPWVTNIKLWLFRSDCWMPLLIGK